MTVTQERTTTIVPQPRVAADPEQVVDRVPVVTYHGRPTTASAKAVENLRAEERILWAVMGFVLLLALWAGLMIGLAENVWG